MTQKEKSSENQRREKNGEPQWEGRLGLETELQSTCRGDMGSWYGQLQKQDEKWVIGTGNLKDIGMRMG